MPKYLIVTVIAHPPSLLNLICLYWKISLCRSTPPPPPTPFPLFPPPLRAGLLATEESAELRLKGKAHKFCLKIINSFLTLLYHPISLIALPLRVGAGGLTIGLVDLESEVSQFRTFVVYSICQNLKTDPGRE